MNFPVLYGVASNGKTKIWTITVKKSLGTSYDIITEHGYIDGKITVATKNILKGKNTGKANETTVIDQAISEAQSKWNKKKDQDYSEKIEKSSLKFLPMLALSYEKRGHDIVSPCVVSAKLDGVRSLFYNGELYSRNGKKFSGLGHIISDIKTDMILDGEIYSEELNFQDFVGLIRKKKFTEQDKVNLKKVHLVVYDYINQEHYKDRLVTLKTYFSKHTTKNVKLLPTEVINKEDIMKYLKKYEKLGYEGLIVRNLLGAYEQKNRSKNLQKLKTFYDDEFKIINFTEGEGIEKGLVIWICETKNKKTFSVRPEGTHEDRAVLFKNAKKYIGKNLTVKYQELTLDGIPRFPVGLAIRNYE